MNCSNYDSDGDNVNDGQEINGYQVTISWYEGEDLKSKDIKVYGDPMGAYKDPEDNYLDVDGDGIFDIDEIDPVNSTNLDWYFEVLKHDPRPQSEKDEQVQNQFNPFIKENIPPKIENIDIKTSAKTKKEKLLLVEVEFIEHCYTRIRAEISDVSEFTVTVKVKDNGKSVTFTGQGNEVFEANIDIDYWTDYLLNYRVKVTAEDVSGNEVEWEKKINGVFGGLLDALAAIWDAIAGAFKAAFELMAKALNFLVDLILSGIKIMIDTVLSPIVNAMVAYVRGIGSIFSLGFADYERNGESFDKASLISSLQNYLGNYLLVIGAVYVGILAAVTLASPFLAVITALASQIIDLIVMQMITSFISSPGSGFEEVIDIANNGVEAIMSYLGEYFGFHHVNPWYDSADTLNVVVTVIISVLSSAAMWKYGAHILDAIGLGLGLLGISLAFIDIGWDEWSEAFLGAILTAAGMVCSLIGGTPNKTLDIILIILNGVCLVSAVIYAIGVTFL